MLLCRAGGKTKSGKKGKNNVAAVCCSLGILSLGGSFHNSHKQQLGRKSVQLLLFKGLKGRGGYAERRGSGKTQGEAEATEKKAGENMKGGGKEKDENKKRVNEAVQDHQRLLIPCKPWLREQRLLAQL